MIKDISKIYNLPIIVSGGVFQNKTLLNLVVNELDEVYFNKKIPINDGGVSIGQLAYGIWNC
jgi:hydrogenase maturation protein HypF